MFNNLDVPQRIEEHKSIQWVSSVSTKLAKTRKRLNPIWIESMIFFFNVGQAEYKNPKLFSSSEISSFEAGLCVIVDTVRQIEYICDNGDRRILRCTNYRNRWYPPRPLGVVIKTILEKVIKIRNNLNIPPVFQEEIDVFMRYQLNENE